MKRIARPLTAGVCGLILTATTGFAVIAQNTNRAPEAKTPTALPTMNAVLTAARPPFFLRRVWHSTHQVDNPDTVRIAIGRQLKVRSVVSAGNRGSFDFGYGFVKAAYFAGVAHEDAEAGNMAIVELVKLADRLENQPELAADLNKALKMVVRGSGSGDERSAIVEKAADIYSARAQGENKFYLDLGLTLTRLTLANYERDGEKIKKELQNLQNLINIAPQSVSGELMTPLKNLSTLAALSNYKESQYFEIDKLTGDVMTLVFAGQ